VRVRVFLSTLIYFLLILTSRNVLANSLYMMGIDMGQGIAPLITAGIAIQYGLASTFTVSAVISAFATIAILLMSRLNQKS